MVSLYSQIELAIVFPGNRKLGARFGIMSVLGVLSAGYILVLFVMASGAINKYLALVGIFACLLTACYHILAFRLLFIRIAEKPQHLSRTAVVGRVMWVVMAYFAVCTIALSLIFPLKSGGLDNIPDFALIIFLGGAAVLMPILGAGLFYKASKTTYKAWFKLVEQEIIRMRQEIAILRENNPRPPDPAAPQAAPDEPPKG